jgi:hypothetical protein
MPRGGSAPGERRGGRQRGTPNRLTGDVRAMILGALSEVGGQSYLARQAEQNPVAFMALVGRVLPLQAADHDGERLEVVFHWRDSEPETINGHAVEGETQDEPPAIDAAAGDAGPVVIWAGEAAE